MTRQHTHTEKGRRGLAVVDALASYYHVMAFDDEELPLGKAMANV